MANKKLLTLADLYKYYSSKNENVTFSATNDAEAIVVQVDGKLNFNKNEETSDYTEGLTPVVLQACHTLCNRNGSMISKENMEKCMPSFKNRPILGYIHEVDGQPEFYGHNMHQNDDGEIIYDEIPIGIIPESCDAKLVYDEEKEHEYVVVNGYLFDDYTKAVEILERENECFVSVELQIRDLSYDAREKALDIKDFFFSGVTILGKSPDGDVVQPGMDGSNIKLADFSTENNSMFSQKNIDKDYNLKLIEILETLNNTLSKFNINQAENANETLEEGGNQTVRLKELLEKYGKTVDDIKFEYENLSDEELDAKFAEEFGKESSEDPTSDEEDEDSEDGITDTNACGGGSKKKKKKCEVDSNSDSEEKEDEEDTSTQEEMSEDDDESQEDDDSDSSITDTNACGGGGSKKKKKKNELDSHTIKCSIESNGNIKTYEVSLQDKIYAIQDLVNLTYSESDNTYYGVQVYEDYVIMVDYWSGRAYKQSYSEEDDSYTLTGDRIEVYSVWVTKEEEEALEEMKANYSSISEELSKYQNAEIKAQKEEILNDAAYAEFAETDEFKVIAKEADSLTVEELRTKCELAFAKLVKAQGTFAFKEETKDIKKKNKIGINADFEQAEDEPYGDYFKSLERY